MTNKIAQPPAPPRVTSTTGIGVTVWYPQLYAAYRYGDLSALEPILVRVAGTAKRLARGKA